MAQHQEQKVDQEEIIQKERRGSNSYHDELKMFEGGKDESEAGEEIEEVVQWEYPTTVNTRVQHYLKLKETPTKIDLSFQPLSKEKEKGKNELEQILRHEILHNTTSFDLSKTGISSLPLDIPTKFLYLLELNVSNNMIKEIPEDLSNLIHLTTIIFTKNQISQFPNFLSQLPNLKELALSDNQIQTLSSIDFAPTKNFQSLVSLRLGRNLISELPATLFYLPSLKRLILNDNFIQSLPLIADSLTIGDPSAPVRVDANITQLSTFDIQNNPILEIPSHFCTLPPLTLSTSLPDEILPTLLYLGNWDAACNYDALRYRNITHVLSICDEKPPVHKKLHHLYIKLDDTPNSPISTQFEACFKFINKAKKKKASLLVHCFDGNFFFFFFFFFF